MRNLKVTMEYDGTHYYGFQYQASLPTVQGTIEQAWSRVLQEPVKLTAAGRTDTGVHAEGQVVSFYTASRMGLEHMPPALNSLLTPDIHVRMVEEVPTQFNARFSARMRCYRYRLSEGFNARPQWRHSVAYFPMKLEARRLAEATSVFEGKKNFFAFCGGGVQAKEAFKTVRHTSVVEADGITNIQFEAPSFLPKMVRMMVAAAIQMAAGAVSRERIEELLHRASEKFTKVAPPQGLSLVAVHYEEVAR
ncbi:MAG: tRNA pseudouridine(38-40) synthase TruA [bacterium]